MIHHHLRQLIDDPVIRAIPEPVAVHLQRDRRIGVAKMVLQIGNRDAALNQNGRAAVAQAVERDGSQVRTPQGRIEALAQEAFTVHRLSLGRGKHKLVSRQRAL